MILYALRLFVADVVNSRRPTRCRDSVSSEGIAPLPCGDLPLQGLTPITGACLRTEYLSFR